MPPPAGRPRSPPGPPNPLTLPSPALHPIAAGSADLLHPQQFDVVEALFEVRLHGLWVAGLAQNLQEVIIGQEVEAREDVALGLQVHVQRLLNVLQNRVHLCQRVQEAWERRAKDT